MNQITNSISKSVLKFFLILAITFPLGLMAQGTKNYNSELRSEDPVVQIKACREVGQNKVESAIPILIELLENSQDREVKWNAALSLGQIGKPGNSTSALLRSARGSGYKSVRYASLLSLAAIQDPNKKDEFLAVVKWTEKESNDDLAKDLIRKIKDKAGL